MLVPLLLFLLTHYCIWKLAFGLLEQNDSCNPFSKPLVLWVKYLFCYVWKRYVIKEQNFEGNWAAIFSGEVPINPQDGNSNH